MPEFVGVLMYPGATQLARIPWGPTSWARLFIIPMTPCLVVSSNGIPVVSMLFSILSNDSSAYFSGRILLSESHWARSGSIVWKY